ncbi:hypothetical protein Acr_28g0000140 [Actinidia rufa]|uniref:Uncharacterized protein n=1 Tax=Actinidia rufa TaxID=165716 RepID=A0A7J0H8C5_9ERIC|nr:hypothetical protein Acr_28g0000140 [Actinidia rufa]
MEGLGVGSVGCFRCGDSVAEGDESGFGNGVRLVIMAMASSKFTAAERVLRWRRFQRCSSSGCIGGDGCDSQGAFPRTRALVRFLCLGILLYAM